MGSLRRCDHRNGFIEEMESPRWEMGSLRKGGYEQEESMLSFIWMQIHLSVKRHSNLHITMTSMKDYINELCKNWWPFCFRAI